MVKNKERACLSMAKRKIFSYLLRKPVSVRLIAELMRLLKVRATEADSLYELWCQLEVNKKYYSVDLCIDIVKCWLTILNYQHDIDVKARLIAIIKVRKHLKSEGKPYLSCGSVVDELVSNLSKEYPIYSA